MSRRQYKPLPQTVHDDPLNRYRVLYRVSSFAAKATSTPEQGWRLVLPPCQHLTKPAAEQVLAREKSGKWSDRFEFKLELEKPEIGFC